MSTFPPQTGRILIGEDTAEIACLMQEVLERAGYSVETTADGAECLSRARASQPDLLLLDLMMPKMNGMEVLKALRAEPATANLGVIVCTAKDFKTDIEECLEQGAADLLPKPFDAPALVETVRAFFSKRARASAALGNAVAPTAAGVAPFAPKLDTTGCRFCLWGTRGSTPTPGGRFLRHGGHTSCLSVANGNDYFIFDAGSGIRELALEIVRTPARRLHLFITHTHWDHIQGFPFFTPAYLANYELIIYGAEGFGKDLKSVFRGQLDRDYFPVQMEDMQAQIEFRNLPAEPLAIGPARISWEAAMHPGATVGYKIEIAGKKITWVPDNEFLLGYAGDPGLLTRESHLVQPFLKMIDFLADADVVIHEAQYTNDEYPQKVRWGHSSVGNAAALMKLAGVERWIVTHHDPLHDDAFLESKLNLTRKILRDLNCPTRVTHGYDGLTEYF
ncbi:MAG TPA: response regulator [Chthoniobacteraceae bacterium]|nr:response regulator [Chthoniobacteraceae bacterium]